MVIKTAFVLFFSLCLPLLLYAEEDLSVQDRAISSTLKILAKAYVASSDMDALKKKGVDDLKTMSEEKFRDKYQEVYIVIKDLPSDIKMDYAISGSMSKEQAVRIVEGLDKKKAYALIDAVPDQMVCAEFKKYLSKNDGLEKQESMSKKIDRFWRHVSGKF